MSILSGFIKTKRYRKTASGYQAQSEWTHSDTVEFADGTTLTTKMTNHTHSPSSIGGGTFSGDVSAKSSTQYTNNQLRNITLLPEENDMGENANVNTSTYPNGSVICIYK